MLAISWKSPVALRIVPFAVYIGFLAIESGVSTAGINFDVRWLYAVKVACVALALGLLWRHYGELKVTPNVRPADWFVSAALGVLVFVLWIVLDQPWAMLDEPRGWDPRSAGGAIDWRLVSTRLIGATIVVPVMEELFWRSLVMRWIKSSEFLKVEPKRVGAIALLVSSALFALEHHQWLAGLLAGLAYGWIYMRSGNLWTAILAHGATNLLLGLYVLYTGSWQFW
jgi:uncharacterized protein